MGCWIVELSEPETVDTKSFHGFEKQLHIFIEEKSIRAKGSTTGLQSP